MNTADTVHKEGNFMKNRWLIFTLLLFFATEVSSRPAAKVAKKAPAKIAQKAPVVAAQKGVRGRSVASDPDAPIEVRGQSRNLNMMLILQNQDEIIDFIKLRKDYQPETAKMNY